MSTEIDEAVERVTAFLDERATRAGRPHKQPVITTWHGRPLLEPDLRALLSAVPRKIGPTAGTDYRAQAHRWGGPGREALVDAIALFLHHNESLHMHEDVGAACCAYCWLRAGKAILALTQAGLMEGGS